MIITPGPGSGAGGGGGTEFNEDTPHTSGDLGTQVLAVRNDAAAALTSTNGDYSPVATDSAGRVGISDLGGSVTVDGPLTDAELRATAVPVSAASLPLPAGAATEATLATRLADATFTGRINTLGQKAMAASTPVVIASDQSSVQVSGPLTDAQLRATPVPVSGTVTANPALGFGKTLQFATIAQGAAGTTELVAAVGGQRIKVVSYVFVMSLAGTAKFRSGASTDMSGAMDIAINGGVSSVSNVATPLMQTVSGEALNIVTTTGAARGHISFFTEA